MEASPKPKVMKIKQKPVMEEERRPVIKLQNVQAVADTEK
jgi:hypothetical protein